MTTTLLIANTNPHILYLLSGLTGFIYSMDVFSLSIVPSSLTTAHDRVMFNHLFEEYHVSNQVLRHAFDSLVDDGVLPSAIVSDLVYAAVFGKHAIVGYSN